MKCTLCPRECGADRAAGERGYCGMGDDIRVARVALHPFEEPCISGKHGSGTVFFVGCSLGCVFCQNRAIRTPEAGKSVSPERLGELFLSLQQQGAHNINLVTATHFAHGVSKALQQVKKQLTVPVVYNCGGYEKVDTLRLFEGLVDIYLPDFKYILSSMSAEYSAAPDYGEVATAALAEMYRQVGEATFDSDGMMRRGVMVRHLVLPGGRRDSVAVLDRIAATVPVEQIRLSLMRQYTPDFCPPDAPQVLQRRLTSFEYDTVAAHARTLGFTGYFQAKESVGADYTPDFTAETFS
ncbi:MAG: radical SAM protein [Clostridia bacterium]|nr:radical SAM protein [Clostridia bacterium]